MTNKRLHMNILVTGGAGYIGSFMTKKLLDSGYSVAVADSLERGHKKAVDQRAAFYQINLRNAADIEQLFCEQSIDAVMHFAGYISVEESVKNPHLYYENNVKGAENLFKAAIQASVTSFIFSSTAAVYGNPTSIPIPEEHPKNPTSPYGKTKLETEELLEGLAKEHNIRFACLRYFNAAGANLDGVLGEMHKPETHIIPNAIRSALQNKEFELFGNDYDTKDGTCIRDYIHVLDLVKAHMLALDKLSKKQTAGGHGFYYNVGTGKGYSNLEVIAMVKKVSGVGFPIAYRKRRTGDPAVLIADPKKISDELGFSPLFSDLETIVKSAFFWHKNHALFS